MGHNYMKTHREIDRCYSFLLHQLTCAVIEKAGHGAGDYELFLHEKVNRASEEVNHTDVPSSLYRVYGNPFLYPGCQVLLSMPRVTENSFLKKTKKHTHWGVRTLK